MSDHTMRASKPESLDEIVSQTALKIAEQIQTAAGWATSEADLQFEVAAALKDFGRRAQIELKGTSERHGRHRPARLGLRRRHRRIQGAGYALGQ